MKTFLFLLVIFISFAVNAQTAHDEELVKKVVIDFQNDFNNGSFKNAASYSTADWEHLNPLGGIKKGRKEILKEVQAVHNSFLKGVTMSIDSMTVRFITLDVAIADVIHKISNYELPNGVKHENERQLKTYVIVKRKGKWLLTQDQNTFIAK